MGIRNERLERLFAFEMEFSETVPIRIKHIRIKLTIYTAFRTSIPLRYPAQKSLPIQRGLRVKASIRCQRVDCARSIGPSGRKFPKYALARTALARERARRRSINYSYFNQATAQRSDNARPAAEPGRLLIAVLPEYFRRADNKVAGQRLSPLSNTAAFSVRPAKRTPAFFLVKPAILFVAYRRCNSRRRSAAVEKSIVHAVRVGI